MGPSEDPLLRRMLITHIHCGEPMELTATKQSSAGTPEVTNDGGQLTYKCPCGFSFDQTQD